MSITTKPELIKEPGGKISYIFKFLPSLDLKFIVELTDKNIHNTQNLDTIVKLLPLKNDNNVLYRNFIQKFIDETRQYFSKKYTVDTFEKLLNHRIESVRRINENESAEFRILDNCIFYPISMVFINQGINLVWKVEHKIASENILITLPDIQESDETNKSGEGTDKLIEIHDFEKDLEQDNNLEMPYEQLSREVALSKVKESRLKAKLAYVQAQISTDNYLKKYGGHSDDFEDSDFYEDSDDNED